MCDLGQCLNSNLLALFFFFFPFFFFFFYVSLFLLISFLLQHSPFPLHPITQKSQDWALKQETLKSQGKPAQDQQAPSNRPQSLDASVSTQSLVVKAGAE